MKKAVWTTAITCFVLMVIAYLFSHASGHTESLNSLKVGFLYENDAATPYTKCFILAQEALEDHYGRRVTTYTKSNVPEEEVREPLQELVDAGCSIIFTNSYSTEFIDVARENAKVQFCQISSTPYDGVSEIPENYHTFKAEAYQGRYTSGIVAGLKIRDLVETRVITPAQAKVGYVASFPTPETISGYTAFLLGVRQIMPEATMKVYYTGTWSDYVLEKECTKQLIEENCLVISQHTDTTGPAEACEEAYKKNKTYHVGYNQGMQEIAPSTHLVSVCNNWNPYVLGAVEAVLTRESIEKTVNGKVHPINDMSGGFGQNWVTLLDLNLAILPYNTQRIINQTISGLEKGTVQPFSGDYTGVDPWDDSDRIQLTTPYEENKDSSCPTFHYILKDIIETENFGPRA